MNPSKLLRRFLDSGKKPSSLRETSALLDESRSLLVSKLPSTSVHIQNLTQGDIDGLVAGGKDGMIDRAVAIHRAQNLSAPRPTSPAAQARPAAASAKPSLPRPSAASKPSAPKAINSMSTNPPSTTPTLDQFEKLEGTAASHFYATHGAAIRAESGTRKHQSATIQKEMQQARATARQRADLKKTR